MCVLNRNMRHYTLLQVTDNKNTCLVQLVSDHTYNAYVGGQAQTVAKMENVLQQVTGLYNQSDFFITDRGIRINVAPAGFQGACFLSCFSSPLPGRVSSCWWHHVWRFLCCAKPRFC